MSHTLLRAAVIAAGLALPLAAQKHSSRPIDVNDTGASGQLALKYATFDPTAGSPFVPEVLRADGDVKLFVVQLDGAPVEADRAAVRAAGGELHGYLPHNAYVVRMSHGAAERVADLARTRFVGAYQPAWRLELGLVAEIIRGDVAPARDYNLVVVDKRTDKPALAAKLEAIGGRVLDLQEGSLLLTARLDGAALIQAARLDEVLWIDRWSPPENDMDNARIQGGADYIESAVGHTGQGVRGHVYEGVEYDHPDFTTPFTNVASGGEETTHGHCTAGIIFGNGTSNPAVRGMAPDALGFYTNYSTYTGSRNAVIGQVVNTHQCMFTTASWGDARTTQYTSVSADADDIIFDHRIPWTQSQSNAGDQYSRPQAWAKNIFSIGGFAHHDNSDAADDSWAGGNGSTGPAADGRIKPDLSAYYDSIGCSDLTGSSGYSNNDWYSSFGGTSGATPICAGHNAIAIQMYTEGLFGNPLRVPGGTRFQNRPYAQTLKALMIANAQQYSFNASSTDNRREHVGWGFPSLRNLYLNRNRMLIVAEDDPLTQGTTRSYTVAVQPSDPELKICMTFVEPAGNPASSLACVNDLTLRVTAPDRTVYWGNHGLTQGNYSTPGGSANTVDSVESVFVANPIAGNWTIDVIATLVVQDAHVATPAVDATYALCAVIVDPSSIQPSFSKYGSSCSPVGNDTLPGTFYEVVSGPLDIANQAIRFTPNGSGGWQVSTCSGCFENGYSNGLGLSDDEISRGHALGFSFPLIGGSSTSSIDVESNGWIGLIANQHSGYDYTESVSEFLSDPARIAAFWDDLNPAAGGDVYFDTFPGRAVITWANVPEYSATGANTAQIQLFPTGEFILAYGAVSSTDGLIGYSSGNGVSDPGQQDLSNPGGAPGLAISIDRLPLIHSTVRLGADNVPATATGAILGLGFTQVSIDLTPMGMPGCYLLTPLDFAFIAPLNGTSTALALPIPNDTLLLGQSMYAQYIALDPTANPFGAITSDGGILTFGN